MNSNMKDPNGVIVVRRQPGSPGYMSAVTLNAMAASIHANNLHFYNDVATGLPITAPQLVGEKIALIHEEVSEMLGYARKGGGGMDSHLPDRPGEEVEAADILIRLLDYCAWRRLDVGGAVIAKLEYNRTRADHTREARLADGGKKF